MIWSDSRQASPDGSRIVEVVETAQPAVVPAALAGGGSLAVAAAPFIRSGPAAVLDLARRADRLEYASLWVAEVTGIEAFSVLGAVSRAAPGLGLGTGVVPMQVRTPPLLATISAYRQAGVDVPVVFPLTWGAAAEDALDSTLRAAIAPAAHGAGWS